MNTKKLGKSATTTQSERFLEAAREVGASEDDDVFDATLKKIAKAPPPETVQDRKKPSKKQ